MEPKFNLTDIVKQFHDRKDENRNQLEKIIIRILEGESPFVHNLHTRISIDKITSPHDVEEVIDRINRNNITGGQYLLDFHFRCNELDCPIPGKGHFHLIIKEVRQPQPPTNSFESCVI